MAKLVLDEPKTKPRLVPDEPEKPDFGMIALPREKLPGVWDYNRQLDELLGNDEFALEDLMPWDVRYDFGRIIGMTEKPDETKAKIENSLYYSIIFNTPPRITFNLLDELNEIAFNKPIDVQKALKEYKDYYTGAKNYVGAIKHGLRRANVMAEKQIGGLAKMVGEFITPQERVRPLFPALNEWEKRNADVLKEWSDMILKDVEEYYRDNKAEAIQILPGIGYWETLKQYITKPVNLVQGIVESGPLMLEGILGMTIGGPVGGIALMAVPISGDVYADARAEDTEPLPAMAQAILIGTGEATIEQWTLGKKLGLMRNYRKLVAGGLPKVIWESTKAFFRGTAEEGSQEFNRNFWRWVFTDRSQQWTENVAESMAAGGPMEMVMAGAFSAAGMVGPTVPKEQQIERIDKIQEAIEAEPTLSEEHKAEIRKELNIVRKDIEADVYKVEEPVEVKAKEAKVSAEKRTQAIDYVKSVLSQEQYAALDEKAKIEIGQKMLAEQGVEVTAEELAKTPPTEAVAAPEKLTEPITKPEAVEVAPEAKQPWEMTIKEDLNLREIQMRPTKAGRPETYYGNLTEEQSRGEWERVMTAYHRENVQEAISQGKSVPRHVLQEYKSEKWAQEALAQPPTEAKAEAAKAKPVIKEEISPIEEPELTKQEEADISRLEAEIEEPFEMVRVKDVGFVIKEKATGKEVMTIAKRKEAKTRLAEYNKGERKVRESRRKPKILTGKATIGKLITEARALKAAMKKVAQAARKAYREGRTEGIAKVKTYYYDLRQREQTRKQLKKRISKAVKMITKDISKSIDFNYREAIENLRAGIDPKFRGKKTLQMRERTREFLAREPEALKDMPVKLLKKLAQKPMNEYTIEEVEKIAEEIERLTKQGKLKRKLRLTQKGRRISETTQELTETISKGEKIDFESEPVTYETTKDGLIKTTFEKVKAWTWRPSRIFDMLDGMKDFAGKAHHIFIDQVNTTVNAKLRAVDKRKDAGIAKMKELGITSRDLAQVRIIDDVRYMVDEMIGIYCANQNRLAKLALMYGNNLNEKKIDKVIAKLTENEKSWGDFIIQDYEIRKDVLREKVIEVENRDMGYEENYIPIRRTEVDYSTHTEEIIDAILQKEHLRRAYAEHGFTVHRKEVPAAFQKPIRLNVTGVWASQIDKQEQYIHLAELIRDLHKIAGDRDFRAAVEQQFGKEFNKIIKNYIDRVANPNIYKSYNALENLSRRLRQNAVIAYLAYNLVTMAKQVPSIFLYLQDAGPTHLISSAMQFVEHPMKMIDMVREKDPQVKHRAIERELEEMKLRNPEMYNNMLAKFGKAGMEGIYLFDAVARTIGWNAVYQKALKSDMSEAEAVRLAQNATLRTQPAAAAKDVAQLYATNEFANWFTMFTNQLNQIYNIATYDMSGYLKNKDYQKFALATTGLSLTALFIWVITKRRLPESKEDWVDVASEQALNAVPLIGKAIMVGKRGWGDTEIPAFELPKAAGRAISAVAKGEFDENDIKAIAEGIAVMSGTPYIGPKRVIKMADTGEIKELVGGEPLEITRKKSGLRKVIK